MVFAQIKDSVVVNTLVLGDGVDQEPFLSGYDHLVRIDELNPRPGVGFTYDGANFSAPAVPPEPIPNVTPRQFRQALVIQGVSLQAISDAINTFPEPTRSLVQIEWEYSVAFIRSNPLVNSVGAMLGMNSAQLDTLWRFAATL